MRCMGVDRLINLFRDEQVDILVRLDRPVDDALTEKE